MANLNSSIINGFLKVTGKLKVNSLEVESNELVSNLNADLLDGKQGSEYASSTDLDNKVDKAGDTMTGTLNGQNIQPAANNTYNLGTSSLKWANAYATTFVGALSGNATSASSAAKLTTARTINGVSFDGTANITVADSTKLSLAGGTMTGTISSGLSGSWLQGVTGERALVKSTSESSAHTALWSAASTNGRFQIFKYTNYMGFGYESATAIDAGTNSLTYGAFFNESGAFYPSKNNAQTLGTSSVKWNNVYATTFTGALSGNASSATKLATARTIGVSGVTGTAQSFDGTANIVIPITAVPATLLTNKSAIKGSEITNDKNWVPSSDASVTNFVSMTAEEYATNANSLATGTIVAITDSAEGYVTTQSTSLTCDLPLDL